MSPDLPDIREIWVYLAASPLLALTLTLAAWQLGLSLYERGGRSPLVNPVAIAVLTVTVTIVTIDMPYAQYFQGAQFVHFLLGTATVALAVPIHRGLASLRGRILPLLAALLGGGAVSIGVALGVAGLMDVSPALREGLWAKSVTAPIAMGVAERIGASPTLTAVYAVITGVLGAALGRFVFDAVGCRAWWQRGAAIGIAAHGIGTSRAFTVHPEAGAWASLAMGLHGVIGAVLIPWAFGR